MIKLPLSQDIAMNLAKRLQKGIQFWTKDKESLSKEKTELLTQDSHKIFRKIELFTDLEIEEIPSVSFTVMECKLFELLIDCCDRKLEKDFFKPMNQQLIALGNTPVIIKGYSEWRYMWKELDKRDEVSTQIFDWFFLYAVSDLDKGHIFKCTHRESNKELSIAIPFSKTFRRAMGMPL